MAVARIEADVPARNPRGDARGQPWPVGPVAVVAAGVLGAAAIAVAVTFPFRSERWLDANLRSVRISNALGSRCQLENGRARPLSFPCGSNVGQAPIRGAGAAPRALAIVRSEHQSCLVDEDTLEAVVCRDTMIEWALLERDHVTIAVLDPHGRGLRLVQHATTSGEVRELLLSHSEWVRTTGDPDVPVHVLGRPGGPHRLGFGTLEPLMAEDVR